jgi:hypothetical protein
MARKEAARRRFAISLSAEAGRPKTGGLSCLGRYGKGIDSYLVAPE